MRHALTCTAFILFCIVSRSANVMLRIYAQEHPLVFDILVAADFTDYAWGSGSADPLNQFSTTWVESPYPFPLITN